MALNPNNPLRLGRQQRLMLSNMAHIGDGRWPPGWQLYAHDRLVMQTLHNKGLITNVGVEARLTRKGEGIVEQLGM